MRTDLGLKTANSVVWMDDRNLRDLRINRGRRRPWNLHILWNGRLVAGRLVTCPEAAGKSRVY